MLAKDLVDYDKHGIKTHPHTKTRINRALKDLQLYEDKKDVPIDVTNSSGEVKKRVLPQYNHLPVDDSKEAAALV